ncbi:hypothetical protein BJF89_13780 [Corynebacterium sp. CNJ-954]|uniref:hypothetical protein n=1 Tax=Corynebacterium sp. CNJ-954 TaxID=1904962 RepID=UPI00096099F9|nr:hypothetical protein [Corynebacterium sp. CNJ-954]OLT55852.1 hypothetical protein BJF89_13780 [Corynebacterium sp. CNJ-954]
MTDKHDQSIIHAQERKIEELHRDRSDGWDQIAVQDDAIKWLRHESRQLRLDNINLRSERDEFQNEMISSERKQAKLEAEVDRLTRIIKDHPDSEFIFAPGGVIGKRAKENLDRMNLPASADVPKGQPYLVDVEGENEHLLGLRNSGEPHPWETFSLNTLGSGGWCSDTDITLVSRLVPDTRRVIDKAEGLDKLPKSSVVLDKNKASSQKIGPSYWEYGYDELTSEELIDRYGPVTVIHEPEADE